MPDYNHADFELLKQSVREAGELAMTFFGNNPKSWSKEDDQPVCEADIAVNDFLFEKLTTARPDYGWLSEETADPKARTARLQKTKSWVIDPIDGTSAFLNNKAEFAISAALIDNHQPILACVFNPATDEFYAAMAGHGATKNTQSIKFSGAPILQDDMHVCVYPPILSHPAWQKAWQDKWPNVRISNPKSVAYRLCLLAEGYFDMLIILNTKNDWDIAAGDLIIREAGGHLSNLGGKTFSYHHETYEHPRMIGGHPRLMAMLGQGIDEFLSAL
ncbi:MAG: 3'(2'),5'-bisphosphate nucleotidase CysQ [Parvibaculales bacterium]